MIDGPDGNGNGGPGDQGNVYAIEEKAEDIVVLEILFILFRAHYKYELQIRCIWDEIKLQHAGVKSSSRTNQGIQVGISWQAVIPGSSTIIIWPFGQ